MSVAQTVQRDRRYTGSLDAIADGGSEVVRTVPLNTGSRGARLRARERGKAASSNRDGNVFSFHYLVAF
jgi:hypothetical protein